MLMAVTDLQHGQSAWKAAAVLERRFRCEIFRRERLRFDTRFSAPTKKTRGVATLVLVTRGEVAIDGRVVGPGPLAYVLAETERERRVDAGAPSLQVSGPVFEGCILELPVTGVRRPPGLRHGPLTLSASTWELMRVMSDALLHASIDDAIHVAAAMVDLMHALCADGVIDAELPASIVEDEAPNMLRLWKGIAAAYAEHRASVRLGDLKRATQLSITQLGRDLFQLTRTFGLFGLGYREAARVMRLRAAVLWLSSPDLTATEVAAIVGYRSTDAMSRAFRDAKLPAASVVQDAVRFADSA